MKRLSTKRRRWLIGAGSFVVLVLIGIAGYLPAAHDHGMDSAPVTAVNKTLFKSA